MTRFFAIVLCPVLALGVVAGCAKQCFLFEPDYNEARLYPAHVETTPNLGVHEPLTGTMSDPMTIIDMDRPARHLQLQEAIAYALEHGTVNDGGASGQSNLGAGSGIANDGLVGFSNSPILGQSDNLRILSMNPAQAAANIEQTLSRYDAQFVSSITWNGTNELTQGSLANTTNGVTGQFQNSLIKAFSYGAIANVSFETDYRDLVQTPVSSPPIPNPLYSSSLKFGYEMPLWRDFGTEINEILNHIASPYGTAMPATAAQAYGNKLQPINQSVALAGGGAVFTEGILIARIRFDMQRAEFERRVDNLVLNVETAYWKLYQAYGTLYSYEELMRLVHKAWMIYYEKLRTGAQDGDIKAYAPIKAKLEELRGDHIIALQGVLDAERNLRRICGIPLCENTRIVPITPPTLASYQPNWKASLRDAMALKPEMLLVRENLRLAQLNLINTRNFLKPDLRFIGFYQPIGFGTSLDGQGQMLNGTGAPVSSNALQSLAGNHFNDWEVGLVFNIPLGFRLEHAQVRQARLTLAQSFELVKDHEERTRSLLQSQYQNVLSWYARIQAATEERKAYGQGLQARFDEIQAGKQVPSADLVFIAGQLSTAMLKQFEAITEYNNTLARYEWVKGSILQYDNVAIAEGPLPPCVHGRAVEHLREQTKALLQIQHKAPLTNPGEMVGDKNGEGPPETLSVPTACPPSAACPAPAACGFATGANSSCNTPIEQTAGKIQPRVVADFPTSMVPSADHGSIQATPASADMTNPRPLSLLPSGLMP